MYEVNVVGTIVKDAKTVKDAAGVAYLTFQLRVLKSQPKEGDNVMVSYLVCFYKPKGEGLEQYLKEGQIVTVTGSFPYAKYNENKKEPYLVLPTDKIHLLNPVVIEHDTDHQAA
jgi:single-stranded DNA-binding protein